VYLHRLDRAWSRREHGTLVRFADDLIALCTSREQAEAALERLKVLLAELGLEPKEAKTRIVRLEVGGGGFDFLGFHHRLVRSPGLNGKRQVTFLARWPADKAMQHARDRIRELTRRSRLLRPVKWIVEDLNRFLRGWAAFFRLERPRWVEELGKPCCVGEQLAYRRRPVLRFSWNQAVGVQVLTCGCVEVDKPLLAQLHNCDRGERLSDRPDPEHRVLGHRRARGDVGEPVTVEELKAPVANHADRQADGGVTAGDRGQPLI
jgi:hypothetical protein